jgi:hypothetical protein
VKVGAARWDKGLVHVQRAGKTGANPSEIDSTRQVLRLGRPLHDRA